MPTQPYFNSKGERLRSVTTIIGFNLGWNKEPLKYWAWKMGRDGKDLREAMAKACDIGTIVHQWVEKDLKGREDEPAMACPDELIGPVNLAFSAYLQWKSYHQIKLLAAEKKLISERYKYGGTLDSCVISLIDGNRVLVDLKTGDTIYPEHLIQMSAYGNAWNETYPEEPIEGYWLLNLSKTDGSFHHHYYPGLNLYFDMFKNLLELDRLYRRMKGKA